MNDADESIGQALGAWETYAGHLPCGEIRELPMLKVFWGNAGSAFFNAVPLNSCAYGTDITKRPEVMTNSSPWKSGRFGYGAFGYGAFADGAFADGYPVAVFPVDGRLHVALVATETDSRGQGYAGAVVRHSIEQAPAKTGLHRITLHATEAGTPDYSRTGCREAASFTASTLNRDGNRR